MSCAARTTRAVPTTVPRPAAKPLSDVAVPCALIVAKYSGVSPKSSVMIGSWTASGTFPTTGGSSLPRADQWS